MIHATVIETGHLLESAQDLSRSANSGPAHGAVLHRGTSRTARYHSASTRRRRRVSLAPITARDVEAA